MNGRQHHWTERKQGQSGGAIGRVELNNFLFTFCGHLTASDNKCVRKEFTMPNTQKTAVEIEWILDVPVREDIYEYIVNS